MNALRSVRRARHWRGNSGKPALAADILELLADERGVELADALADRALRVEHAGAQLHARALGGHDAREHVLQQRLEEGRDEDDDDLVLAVGVVAADARVDAADAVCGERAAPIARRAALGAAVRAVSERRIAPR